MTLIYFNLLLQNSKKDLFYITFNNRFFNNFINNYNNNKKIIINNFIFNI